MYCVCVCLPPPLLLPPCSDWVCLIECSERGGLRQCWHSGSGRPPLGMTADHSPSQHPNYPEMEGAKEGGGGGDGGGGVQTTNRLQLIPIKSAIPLFFPYLACTPSLQCPTLHFLPALWLSCCDHVATATALHQTFFTALSQLHQSLQLLCVCEIPLSPESIQSLSLSSLFVYTHTRTHSPRFRPARSHTLWCMESIRLHWTMLWLPGDISQLTLRSLRW